MKIWLRPLPFALVLAYAAARSGRSPVDDKAPSRSAALCSALAHIDEGRVECAGDAVAWIDQPSAAFRTALGHSTRAVFRGHDKREDTIDLYLVTSRLSPEGHLLEVEDVRNVTNTTNADEGLPKVNGSLVAYVIEVNGRAEAVHVLDLAGHDPHAADELSRGQRMQNQIADLQQTGQLHGIKHTVYALSPAAKSAELVWNAAGSLEVHTEARTIMIDAARGEVVGDGAAFVRVSPEVIAKPPTFAAWMSDRLRAVSWFGDEKNQALKAVAFTALEWFKGTRSKITGDTGQKDVDEDLGSVAGRVEPANFTDPEIGWPPKALDPMLKPPLTGEGQWISLDKDPFITPIPGVAEPFLTTFVRTDPSAPQTRVYITLWDPRLIALHMEAGTVEPVSATGEAGPGQIPRTPEIMRHVVAGFNGGFQATHGEFGMQADGVLYLPPKPYAATVMELRDGTTALGAWPKDTQVPDEVLSFRQNMTALVQNDKYNPWGRNWWGGVPPGWHDAIHSTRSGICLTKQGYVGYFYGNDIGPEPLGRAMLIAGCAFGIHLDMNPGLAGFEFYDVQETKSFQPLGRPLQPDWEYEGSLKDMPDFKFRSRRMVKSMGHMLFPRYIHRDARDFFYLTTRTVLPGTPIGDDPWRVKGLPQHGYPYAVAITTAPTPGVSHPLRVLRIDPRTVRVEEEASTEHAPLVALFTQAAHATTSTTPGKHHAKDAGAPAPPIAAEKLWLGAHVFTIAKTAPPSGIAIADVVANAADARAAVGIGSEDGMLQWVELAPEDKADAATSDAMLKMLERLGCSSRALVAGDVRAFLGGSMDLAAQPTAVPGGGVRVVRAPAPAARAYFESTEIVAPTVWAPLQQARVKWRPTLAPPDKPAASASGTPATPGTAPPR